MLLIAMAKTTLSLPFALLCFLILSLNSGGKLAMAEESKTWCVAKPSATDVQLQNNIQYVCIEQGLDCKAIQPGGSCYEPICLINHASVVMNLYYQKYGRESHTCFFQNSGLAVFTDPSYGSCLYQFNP